MLARLLRKSSVFSLLILSLVFLVSCGRSAKSAAETLRLNLGAEPSVINPLLSTDSASASVEDYVFSGLMKVDPDLKLLPDLADSYTISPDGKCYQFKLKAGVKFQDGTSLTSDDIAFTIQTLLDPKTRTVRRSDFQVNGQAVQVRIIDPLTVEFHLAAPFAPFLSSLTIGILPKHLLAGKDINTATFNRHPIGTGPFKLSSWQPGQFVKLDRNPLYYGTPPKLDHVLLKIIPDYNTALVAFRKGELHLGSIKPKDLSIFNNHSKIKVVQYDTLSYTFVGFNLKHPTFQDQRVRLAIAHAINKDSLVKNVLKGVGRPAHLPSAPASWAYPQFDSAAKIPYDPQKSRQLLTQAGYKLDPKTGIFQKNGVPLSFTLITNKGEVDREKTAQVIQQFLREVGIDMQIQVLEWTAFLKRINDPKTPKPFEAVLLGWSLGIDPDGYSIWHSSEYPTGFNFIGYSNPIVDQGLIAGRLETDPKKRKLIYEKVFLQIAADVPYLFLYYPKAITGIQPGVKGLSKPGPMGLLNTIEDVYLK